MPDTETKTFELTADVLDAITSLVAMSFVCSVYAGGPETADGRLLIKKMRAATKTLRRAGILPPTPDGKTYP